MFGNDKRWPEATTQYRDAMAITEKLAHDFPTNRAYAVELGSCYLFYATSLREGGRPAEALDWYDKAINTFESMHRRDMWFAVTLYGLCEGRTGRAETLMRLGRAADSLADWDRTLELRDTSDARFGRALALANAGRPAQAIAGFRQALAAGYCDIPNLLKDRDLAALRGRADYAALLWDLADAPMPAKK
jgi:tetratricopeptide (TPR) repeat protein